jgi:hypothetical protein
MNLMCHLSSNLESGAVLSAPPTEPSECHPSPPILQTKTSLLFFKTSSNLRMTFNDTLIKQPNVSVSLFETGPILSSAPAEPPECHPSPHKLQTNHHCLCSNRFKSSSSDQVQYSNVIWWMIEGVICFNFSFFETGALLSSPPAEPPV